MAKSLQDVLKGVKSSSKVKNDLGGYKPKAGDEADFAAKQEIDKHDDRVGNGDDVYKGTTKQAKYPRQKDGVYESKKAEDVSCNNTPAGTKCPMHEMADCSGAKTIKEISTKLALSYAKGSEKSMDTAAAKGSAGHETFMKRSAGHKLALDKTNPEHKRLKAKVGTTDANAKDAAYKKSIGEDIEQVDELSTDLLHRAAHKAAKVAMTDVQGRSGPIFKKRAAQANKFRAKGMEQEKKEKAAAVKEEIEPIDEISKKLAARYNNKVGREINKNQPNDPDKLRKRNNREAGSKLSFAKYHGYKVKVPATEEIEQVDELSKKTLGSYAQSATRDALSRQYALGKGDKTDTRKLMNRRKGIDKAVDKLTKEEIEQIDELSPATMKSYVQKAGADKRDSAMKSKVYSSLANTLQNQSPKDANDVRAKGHDHYANAKKRGEGIKLAKKKLGEENVEEGAKVDRMVAHIKSSEKSAGKSDKNAENIAWATANKRGMLDNKNKKMEEDVQGIAKKYKDYVTGGGTPDTASRYKSHVNILSKKTGQHPDAINKDVRKHVKKMKEDLAIPLLGGDHPPRGESEEAIEMVKAELKALANKAMHLVMQMPQGMHVEPWCQSKIAQAKSYISDVHDYMIYGDHKEEDEQVDTPMDMTSASNPTNSIPNMSADVGRNV